MEPGPLSAHLKIAGRIAPNRIVYQSMEANDADERGNPTERTIRRYERLAAGNPGMLFVEALTINYESRSRLRQLKIDAETAPALEKMVRQMRQINPEPLIIFQLAHSGRLSHADFSQVVAIYPPVLPPGRLLSDEEIELIGKEFVQAAVIAKQVGADGIDFKHCHGYFCGEMLRPANRRQGRFGGDFTNRTSFFRETFSSMKQRLGKDERFLLGMRYSVYEGIPGGFGTSGPEEVAEDLTEPLAFARLAESLGMNYLNISAGIPALTPEITRPTSKYPPGVYRHFGWTKAIREVVTIPVIGSGYSYLKDGQNGLIAATDSQRSFTYYACKNIAAGAVDLVGVGRQILADPLFARKILAADGDPIAYCQACGGCSNLLKSQKEVGCSRYDEYYGQLLKKVKTPS
jgi:2,4-dienoyl-CoA reductase-like NADH-dependent reductase (Old Yellow Enzyme family)